MNPSKCSPTQNRNIQDPTTIQGEPEKNITVSRTFPVFFQYGEYSVNLKHLTKQDVEAIQTKLAELNITLIERGYNF